MTSKSKKSELRMHIIGRVMEVIGFCILIVIAVLLNMENKDLGTIGFLLVVGILMFFTGLVFSRLPQERREEKGKNAK